MGLPRWLHSFDDEPLIYSADPVAAYRMKISGPQSGVGSGRAARAARGKAIAELRRQVGESKFVITPEAIAKVLVDHGHLTPFQARKLVGQAQGNEPDPIEQRIVEKTRAARPSRGRSKT